MNADRYPASRARSPRALEPFLDEEEFLAACAELAKEPNRSRLNDSKGLPDATRDEASLRTMPSAAEQLQDPATRPNFAEVADLQKIIRRLEAHVEELRESLTESQAQVQRNSGILRENEMLRQSLAHAHEQRSADAKALEDLMRQGSPAQSEVLELRQALSVLTADRAVDIADLKEAKRRETEARAELETLREELDNVKLRHDEATTALDAARQRGNEARTELATAMTLVLDHDSALARLRQVITERDREIDELRRHVLEAEEARAADAAAFLDSLNGR